MKLATALASGAFVYLAAGFATGYVPRLRFRRQPSRQVSKGQLWLTQAGLALTPAQFWAGSALLGLAAFAVLASVTSTVAVTLVPAVCVALIPRWVFARRRVQRLKAVKEAWPDALRELSAAVATGMSLPQALHTLAAAGPAPMRDAFARFGVRSRVMGVVPALETIRDELADPSSDRVIEVLILAHERGGRLVLDVLQDLAETTVHDVRTAETIETEGLEQKLNARAVFALPWLVLLALTAQGGHFRTFYQSPGGVLVVAAAGAASLFGLWIVGRLTSEPIEERVVGAGHGADAG